MSREEQRQLLMVFGSIDLILRLKDLPAETKLAMIRDEIAEVKEEIEERDGVK